MAAHGKSGAIYIAQHNFSGYTTSWNFSLDSDAVEVTTMADVAKAFLQGDYGFTLGFETLFDAADTGWNETAFSQVVTTMADQYVCLAPTGVAVGTEPVYELVAQWTSEPIVTSIGDAVRISGSMQGTGSAGFSRGYVLQSRTVTTTTTETGYNIGVVASGTTSIATWRVKTLTGTYVGAMEESQNDGGADPYAAVVAYASGSIVADGVTRKTTTGAIEAWRRVRVTGAPTTAEVLVTNTISPLAT